MNSGAQPSDCPGGESAWIQPGFLEAGGPHLAMDGRDLVTLAQERGTPLYVYSERRVVDNARRMLAACAAVDPRVTICYAAKACAAAPILRLLRAEGVAIEVNSGGELFKAGHAGFPPDAIVFNGVAKTVDEIAAALSPPIKAINVDSLFELDRILAVARRLGTNARIALRIVPGVVSATSPGNQTGSEATKFGILERELPAAIERIGSASGVLQLVGLHAHIGSQITDALPYATAARALTAQVIAVQNALGRRLEHVNIGGGFPLPYMRGAEHTPQGDIFAPRTDLSRILAATLPPLREALGDSIEIIIEPGRSMVGDAAVLLSTVENIKDRDGARWLFLDAGYNVLVESYTYKWYYHALTANKLAEPTAEFRLAGPLCDNGDAFFDVDGEQTVARLMAAVPRLAAAKDVIERMLIRLPPMRRLAASTAPGDLVAFLDCGAYTLDQLTPNNGRPRPEAGLLRREGDYRILRRRDRLEDLLLNETP